MVDGGCRLIEVKASPGAVSSPVLLLVLAASLVLRVHDVAVHSVALLMETDSVVGRSRARNPHTARVYKGRESGLAVRFAVGPIRVQASEPVVLRAFTHLN